MWTQLLTQRNILFFIHLRQRLQSISVTEEMNQEVAKAPTKQLGCN